MNRSFVGAICALVFLLEAGCASHPANVSASPSAMPEEAKAAYSLGMDEAIVKTAEEISAALPEGRRVAVTNFESESPELSAYIMAELTNHLARGRKLIMLDRGNIAYIEKELDFQMSGAVSDKSAQSIGKMLGAQSIAVGSLTKRGTGYRWRVSVLEVESGVAEAPVMLEVRGGREYTALLSDLKSSKKAAGNTAREMTLARLPQTAADYLNRGLIFAIRSDFDLALLDFDDAIRMNPNMALAYLQRGKTYLARQVKIDSIDEGFELSWTAGVRNKTPDDDRALADLTKAIALAPNLTAAWWYRGSLYSEIREYDKAIADYNQAVRNDPNHAKGYVGRGNTYVNKSDYDRAIADFTQAIKINPDYVSAYSNRGNTYAIKKDYDRAIADYTQAIRINPDYAVAYYNRGNTYAIKKDYDRAIADYTQAIRFDQNHAFVYSSRGGTYAIKGDYDRAIADYTQAIRLDPDLATAYNKRGFAYGHKGDYDRAIADFTQAIRINPDYATAYFNRGNTYVNKSDYDRAIADYTQAIRMNPNMADAYAARGLAYNAKGNPAQARADMAKAVQFEPGNPGYRRFLEMLLR